MIATARIADEQSRVWWVSAMIALVAHVLVFAALALRVEWTAARAVPPPATAMTVEVAELPAAPPVPEKQLAPGPKRVEARSMERHERELKKTKFDPPPQVEASEAVVVQKREHLEPEPDPMHTSPATQTTAPTAVPAQPSKEIQAPAEGARTNRQGTAEQIWEGKVLARLERYKRYPSWAQRQHLEDTVYLDFTLDRKGRVLEYHIDRSAGYEMLNVEVVSLVQRAAPFPPPPKEVVGESIELLVPIEFFMNKRASAP